MGGEFSKKWLKTDSHLLLHEFPPKIWLNFAKWLPNHVGYLGGYKNVHHFVTTNTHAEFGLDDGGVAAIQHSALRGSVEGQSGTTRHVRRSHARHRTRSMRCAETRASRPKKPLRDGGAPRSVLELMRSGLLTSFTRGETPACPGEQVMGPIRNIEKNGLGVSDLQADQV